MYRSENLHLVIVDPRTLPMKTNALRILLTPEDAVTYHGESR